MIEISSSNAEAARAKVNLFLHVTGRRLDGYHLLDSLAVFPEIGDALSAQPAAALSLKIEGPFAAGLSSESDNLVLRAARALDGARGAALTLNKRLPVASGVGGGSADAAAALRLLNRLWGLRLSPEELARRGLALGADVPVCVASQAARMSGVGEALAPANLSEGAILLINPGGPLATADVFRALEKRDNLPAPDLPAFKTMREAARWLSAETRNDLERPALRLRPVIGEVLAAIAAQGALLARMSGSGATCFGLYETPQEAETAAESLRARAPAGWWIAAAPLKGA